MNTPDIRFTETNSADDSQGRTWGLDGNLFWFIAMRMGFFASVLIAAVPLALCATYVFVFRQGKPRGYDLDCLDYWLSGAGFGPVPERQPQHPLCLNERQTGTSSMI